MNKGGCLPRPFLSLSSLSYFLIFSSFFYPCNLHCVLCSFPFLLFSLHLFFPMHPLFLAYPRSLHLLSPHVLVSFPLLLFPFISIFPSFLLPPLSLFSSSFLSNSFFLLVPPFLRYPSCPPSIPFPSFPLPSYARFLTCNDIFISV